MWRQSSKDIDWLLDRIEAGTSLGNHVCNQPQECRVFCKQEDTMKRVVSIAIVVLAILSLTTSALADTQTIYSDTSVMVYGPLSVYTPLNDSAWGVAQQAVATWVHQSWPKMDPAIWISNPSYHDDPFTVSTWRLFRKTINLCENAHDVSGTITANSDNAEEVYLNGVLLGSEGTVQGDADGLPWWDTPKDYNFSGLHTDTLTFDIIVRNYPGGSTPEANPTGLIFSIELNYNCELQVAIDIKPNSNPSCFNNDGNGVIPVAILGSETFNVHQVNVSTVRLEGLQVIMKASGRYMAAFEDVNKDGYVDLVLKFYDVNGVFDPGDEYATLTGNLLNGTPFFGVGDICVRH